MKGTEATEIVFATHRPVYTFGVSISQNHEFRYHGGWIGRSELVEGTSNIGASVGTIQ